MVLIIRQGISFLLSLFLLLGSPAAAAEDAPALSAKSAVLMGRDGQILYEKDGDARRLIASTTKLMTAILVLEEAALDEQISIRPEWCRTEGSSMYLEEGQTLTVRQLLLGLLLASGNDAAVALACHTAGSEAAFVRKMNDKAAALGLRDTHFANPHGLNDEAHYSTAADLGRLMAYCMENQGFVALAGTEYCTVGEQTFTNHNKLLGRCPGCVAGKTGYTEKAGRCLVSCCEREGTRLICVTLSDPDDWADHMALYDWGFSRFAEREVTAALRFPVPVISGAAETVDAVPDPIRLLLPRTAALRLEAELPRFVFAPVEAGQRAGLARIFRGDELLAVTELRYAASVSPAIRADARTSPYLETQP